MCEQFLMIEVRATDCFRLRGHRRTCSDLDLLDWASPCQHAPSASKQWMVHRGALDHPVVQAVLAVDSSLSDFNSLSERRRGKMLKILKSPGNQTVSSPSDKINVSN